MPGLPSAHSSDWLSAVSGNWEDGSNWSTVPNYPGDGTLGAIPVTITGGELPFTIAIDSSINIDDLSLNANDLTLDLSEVNILQVGLTGRPHRLSCEFFPCSGPVLPPDGFNFIEGVSSDLIVGRNGTPAVAMQSGGTVKVSDAVLIGSAAEEIGEYTVSGGKMEITRYWGYEPFGFIPGPGAWFELGGELQVGGAGIGRLNIVDGGIVTVPGHVPTVLGDLPGSNGSLKIVGAESRLSVGRTLGDSGTLRTFVGRQGVGSLNIELGGSAKLDSMTIGQSAGSYGTVAISGTDSLLETDESISVGSGTIRVSEGARLNPDYGLGLGAITGEAAELTVEGSGTQFDGWLRLHGAGVNRAEIHESATAISYWASVSGPTSEVSVDGAGTQWLIQAENYVPHINSYLHLFNGGVVSVTGGAYMASQKGMIGLGEEESLVLLDGAETRWDVFDGLFVGGSAPENGPIVSKGTLRLANDATVGVASGLKVWPTGAVEGSGTIEGNVDNEGLLLVGQASNMGRLAVSGDLIQRGVLEIDVTGREPATEFDQVVVSGMADLGGTLEVNAIDDVELEVGELLVILRAEAGIFNKFDSVMLPQLDQGRAFRMFYGETIAGLEVILAGDYDGDGDADGRDFLTWQRDPSVGKLSDWQANYGNSSLTLNKAAVPEPAACYLTTFGLFALALGRGRSVVSCVS